MRSVGAGFIDGFAAGARNYRPAAPSSLNACGFLAEHLDRLEALLVVRENRVGHFSRRPGAGQPLRAELQGRFSLSETLQDERSPSRQVLFHDPSFLDICDFIVPDIALVRDSLVTHAVAYAGV